MKKSVIFALVLTMLSAPAFAGPRNRAKVAEPAKNEQDLSKGKKSKTKNNENILEVAKEVSSGTSKKEIEKDILAIEAKLGKRLDKDVLANLKDTSKSAEIKISVEFLNSEIQKLNALGLNDVKFIESTLNLISRAKEPADDVVITAISNLAADAIKQKYHDKVNALIVDIATIQRADSTKSLNKAAEEALTKLSEKLGKKVTLKDLLSCMKS